MIISWLFFDLFFANLKIKINKKLFCQWILLRHQVKMIFRNFFLLCLINFARANLNYDEIFNERDCVNLRCIRICEKSDDGKKLIRQSNSSKEIEVASKFTVLYGIDCEDLYQANEFDYWVISDVRSFNSLLIMN